MLLIIKNLNKSFNSLKVLDNINLEIKKGEKISLLGPSGCGKTTFLRIIAELESYDGNIQKNYQKIAYIFQEPRLIPWKTVFKNLEFVENHPEKINQILSELKLLQFKDFHPNKLSGGMQQRINLARALIVEPELLLLDEPFSSLDIHIKWKLIKDINKQISKKNITSILVTHDIKEAISLSDRILVLSNRPAKIIKEYSTSQINEEQLSNEIIKLWEE
ncbi:ABC transporter ATP-binding protein [Thermosipho melanesiensis]|uniref:ABC transporter related n=2 Tax=Thermosipho melanesiensis TaxID=46541 RepID=A6LLD6_THEM4|nr:ABC transporter ATP-binding protein [Thermosipho melanesiensis]ABR30737.1 ABC transporter related [Thermosipho melanesiensis BI429]APT73863.1 ABC transporter ATP-binding protein [Thermosipho melanesiensis]OOC35804.1 ABC transporter ATP-binding protein [Thermosipho melanesiensis]OOC38306.1 ABC transporter ATP-binding protein [Thermosipho melanesiensis]OOC38767.1 ABC transporter ATP-binding protein [Thermosipho melanesiensis]